MPNIRRLLYRGIRWFQTGSRWKWGSSFYGFLCVCLFGIFVGTQSLGFLHPLAYTPPFLPWPVTITAFVSVFGLWVLLLRSYAGGTEGRRLFLGCCFAVGLAGVTGLYIQSLAHYVVWPWYSNYDFSPHIIEGLNQVRYFHQTGWQHLYQTLLLFSTTFPIWFALGGWVMSGLEGTMGWLDWRGRREEDETFVDETGITPGDLVLMNDRDSGEPVIFKRSDRRGHLAVIGPTGSGKSVLLQKLIAQDIKNDIGVGVIDTKGDLLLEEAVDPYGVPGVYHLANGYDRPVHLLMPGHPATAKFNPLAGPTEIVKDAHKAIFSYLERESGGSTASYFSHIGDAYLSYAITVVKRLQPDNPSYELFRDILSNDALMLDKLKALAKTFNLTVHPPQMHGHKVEETGTIKTPHEQVPDEHEDVFQTLEWFYSDYFIPFSEARDHVSGMRYALGRFFRNPDLMELFTVRPGDTEVSFEQALKHNTSLCIGLAMDTLGISLARSFGAMISIFLVRYALRRPPHQKPFYALYMDEFAHYVNDSFADFLSQVRSYEMACVLGYQGQTQLASRRSQAFADDMANMTRSKLLFGGLGGEDVAYFQHQFGQRWATQSWDTVSRTQTSTTFQPTAANIRSVERDFERPFIEFNEMRRLEANYAMYEIVQDRRLRAPGIGLIEPLRPQDVDETVFDAVNDGPSWSEWKQQIAHTSTPSSSVEDTPVGVDEGRFDTVDTDNPDDRHASTLEPSQEDADGVGDNTVSTDTSSSAANEPPTTGFAIGDVSVEAFFDQMDDDTGDDHKPGVEPDATKQEATDTRQSQPADNAASNDTSASDDSSTAHQDPPVFIAVPEAYAQDGMLGPPEPSRDITPDMPNNGEMNAPGDDQDIHRENMFSGSRPQKTADYLREDDA